MAHSYSSLGIQRILMNGQEVGEIETIAALAGWFGVPVILLTGDQAAADDLHAIVPEAEVAVVKEGLGYYACISLSAKEAQKLIEQQAARAFTRIGRIRPYKIEGPVTIGLVPERYRPERVEALKRGADFAAKVGVSSITTHVGFIPESPNNPLYPGLVDALREVVDHCAERGLAFCFETGQETPTTLLRVIEDLGGKHLGINLDPANLLMYGKANPVDALDVFGQYVMGVHAKDGEYPTNGRQLGIEKPLGEGRVNFPVLVPKLKSLGYTGALTIEREISGPRQIVDIKRAIEVLSRLA